MLRSVSFLALVVTILCSFWTTTSDAFTAVSNRLSLSSLNRGGSIMLNHKQYTPTTTQLCMIFKRDKDDEDLSFIETRDMSREEMQEYNRQFEDTVNQELIGMTIFSLIISLPLLYLAWVGFFAETAEIAGDF